MKVTKDELITIIANDLPSWLKDDPDGFWVHIKEMEKVYLKRKTLNELKDMASTALTYYD